MNEVDQFGMQAIDAIKHLVVANRYLQALVVLYSAIDTLAWASLSSGDVTRSDFCHWVDAYMTPQVQIGCTSEDLYGARCALVHSSTPESRMSREGRARELWYVTSPHSVDRLQSYSQKVGAKAKIVHFTSLVAAFTDGAMKFSQELASDPARDAICTERMKRWLRFLPIASLDSQADE